MLGERTEQRSLWEADRLYIDHVGRGSFYGLLASMRGQLFEDEEFAELYCADNGRDSVPPSLLSTALLLQTHDRVSDAEAKQRADFDIRWKVALGIEVEDRPFAKSTLQLFRARLILHEKVREVFERSLRFARETGYLKSRRMKVALDTTYILGRGAVKDTYNLLSDGIVKLVRALSEVERSDLDEWAAPRRGGGLDSHSLLDGRRGRCCRDDLHPVPDQAGRPASAAHCPAGEADARQREGRCVHRLGRQEGSRSSSGQDSGRRRQAAEAVPADTGSVGRGQH